MTGAGRGSDDEVRPPELTESELRVLAEELRLSISKLVRGIRAQNAGLPRVQAEALAQLDEEGAQMIAELAARRGVRHQGMSRAVADLDSKGYITRSPNPADRRGFVISLSPAGKRALENGRDLRRDALARAIAERLDHTQVDLLRQVPELLRRITP